MLDPLIRKYRAKGVLIDTNLLLPLVVGGFNPEHLHKCRGTKNFTPGDFEMLRKFVGWFDLLITTPHILTEVSNLALKLPETLHSDILVAFRVLLNGPIRERHHPCRELANDQAFLRFGLTDTAIAMVAPGKYLVLTDDLALFGVLAKRGVDVLNFNRIRTFE
jgi:hypothetical protein